ncbi:hypothetical protein AB5I41_07195 [Sphingomonas sp. MMS24-JH45]
MSRRRRVPAAPAAPGEERAGSGSPRRHADGAVQADRRHRHLDRRTYSRFKVDRLDVYFDARSFGRALSNNGQPLTSVRDIAVDENGSLINGTFDGVDLRSEMQQEKFTSTFKQVNLNIDHRFSDTFRMYGLAGVNQSVLYVDRLQVAIDFERYAQLDDRLPQQSRHSEDHLRDRHHRPHPLPIRTAARQRRPARAAVDFIRRNEILSKTFELNGEWQAADGFIVQVGGQYRTNRYTARERQLTNTTPLTLPSGVSVSDFTFVTTGIGKNLDGQLQ